jgi:hypothetical protein
MGVEAWGFSVYISFQVQTRKFGYQETLGILENFLRVWTMYFIIFFTGQ